MNQERNPNAPGVCPACMELSAVRGSCGGYCRPCFNAYQRVRRRAGRDTYTNSKLAKDSRRALKAELVALKGGKCVRCGYVGDTEARRAALHFHHAGRVFAFRMSTASTRNREAFIAEVEKCELLCSNCHIEEHFEDRRGAGRPRKAQDQRTAYFQQALAHAHLQDGLADTKARLE